eukprot:Plantae.Rhodophyta-Purpureofilum_apyrenoidigerum.ctg10380.p1 GENE.Plantae.Rhodophyta-Purpureofilum_apyrenoidigerum.ctg10380~~Plantae.Rhodophyta-Purpureofilum_apyrenoidigerum.ctg10380.p1  ORF type:complete len:465 (-),score=60.75 Plantae.Rhodophyta-Purpureofilum_apyrenoidigerum.ctg10380:1656-3050(-)
MENGGSEVDFVQLPDPGSGLEESEDEDQADYRPGGYLSITSGDEFKNARYVVLEKLGWGHFSTVWLAFDRLDERIVAIKIQKGAEHYEDAAIDEIRLLEDLRMSGNISQYPVVHLIDHFKHQGRDGRHVCLVFEVLGKSLLSLIRRCNYNGIPAPLVRNITRQILEGLNYVHIQSKIIHTDIKPENVVFVPLAEEMDRLHSVAQEVIQNRYCSSSVSKDNDGVVPLATHLNNVTVSDDARRDNIARRPLIFNYRNHLSNPDEMYYRGNVKIVDFGNGCWVHHQFTADIQTRQYRSPEVILGSPYDTSADIWSTACLVFELLTGEFLFDPHESGTHSQNEDHLAFMIELLGPMPATFVGRGRRANEFFTPELELKNIRSLQFWSMKDVLREKYFFSPEESNLFSDFLLPMLAFEPSRRATAQQCLQHPWMSGSPHPRVDRLLPSMRRQNAVASGDEPEERQANES